MTYEEWAATVERGVTITPEMAFAAGSVMRDAEIAELVAALEAVLWWDRNRDYIIPYRVRDPINAALDKVRKPLDESGITAEAFRP